MIMYAIIIILLIVCIGLAYLLKRSLEINRSYELFFFVTVEELRDVTEGINSILKNKPLFTEDTDVRELLRGIRLAAQVLNSYVEERDNVIKSITEKAK